MKSNLRPTASKSLELTEEEVIMMAAAINFALELHKTMGRNESRILESIINKLDAPEHSQNN